MYAALQVYLCDPLIINSVCLKKKIFEFHKVVWQDIAGEVEICVVYT